MYQDLTVQVAVLLSLCVFQRLFLTKHRHTHNGTGKCETSSVDGHSLYSMIWINKFMMLADLVCKRPGMQDNN